MEVWNGKVIDQLEGVRIHCHTCHVLITAGHMCLQKCSCLLVECVERLCAWIVVSHNFN